VVLGRSNGLPGIFRNLGDGQFENRSLTAGILPLPRASVVIAFDFDGDGLLDLFFGQVDAGNRLYRNIGDFEFEDVTAGSGLGEFLPTKGACVADFDGDGRLDLYICNYWDVFVPANRRNRLYRNLGGGVFEDVAEFHGVESPWPGLQCAWVDIDGDGWPDLLLANDRGVPGHPNQAWLNHKGSFVEVTEESGFDLRMDSMCLAVGDLDLDGRPDFYFTNTPNDSPPMFGANGLLVSGGEWPWERAEAAWGVEHNRMSWGGLFWDFDNDGLLDLYVNSEHEPNSLYWQAKPGQMLDIAEALAIEGTTGQSFVSVFGDIDGSGALDLVQNNHGGMLRIYINHEGRVRNHFRLRVAGGGHHRVAVAAQARIRYGHHPKAMQERWSQVIVGGNSYLGQNESTLHFGLGDVEIVDEVEVRWPAGGPTRVLRNLAANHTWTAYHPDRLGDGNGDGVVDEVDLALLVGWLETPLVPGREMMDLDGDGAITRMDLALLYERAGWRRADLDRDGVVGGADLALLLSQWGGSDPIADLDGDGVVGGSDLAGLLAGWGR
jgi:hypothetical protein